MNGISLDIPHCTDEITPQHTVSYAKAAFETIKEVPNNDLFITIKVPDVDVDVEVLEGVWEHLVYEVKEITVCENAGTPYTFHLIEMSLTLGPERRLLHVRELHTSPITVKTTAGEEYSQDQPPLCHGLGPEATDTRYARHTEIAAKTLEAAKNQHLLQ